MPGRGPAAGRPTARRSQPARPRRGGGPTPVPDQARLVAWEVLRGVDEGAYGNLLLPRLLRQRRLADRDSAFATELAYGSLRALGQLDVLLDRASSRPLADIDPRVRDALRLGAYQLLHTRVPPHAAVASAVELVRATSGERPVGFANAVLRSVAADVAAAGGDPTVLFGAADDALGLLAVREAHPRWIASAFADALGGDSGETAAALAADNERPVTHLVARPGRISRDELLAQAAAAGLEVAPGNWSEYAAVLSGGDPGRLEAVRTGRAAVQDEGSQLVALATAAAPTLGPDTGLVVDLCAGPGGKAALLQGLLPSDRVVGVERRASRAALVAASGVEVVVADGRQHPFEPGSADRVLVDAPCTGLGALRRRPEARWRRSERDVPELARLQRELLAAALDLVRPGGVVAYATCSPHLAETRAVTDAVLAGPDLDVERLDARDLLPPMTDLGGGPDVQLWPHRQGTDAMYLAVLRRPVDSATERR